MGDLKIYYASEQKCATNAYKLSFHGFIFVDWKVTAKKWDLKNILPYGKFLLAHNATVLEYYIQLTFCIS